MILALLAVLAAATPEAAPPTAAPPPAAGAPAAANAARNPGDEIVCKTEAVTGSMFPKKICRKKSEVDAARLDQQAQIRNQQRSVTPVVH
jgi:hypothetical protein